LRGQGLRFVLVGGVVAAVYLLVTTFLSVVVGVSFQVALAIAFCFAIALHFTLQRMFVWAHDEGFALSLRKQMGRYLPAVGAQYCVTALVTALLPSRLGVSTEAVYVITALLLAVGNFMIFRHKVFHSPA
jgi:putative flippase GtrA